jgi:hypothetical protein
MLHQVQSLSVKLDMNIMMKIEGISRYVAPQCPATREDHENSQNNLPWAGE